MTQSHEVFDTARPIAQLAQDLVDIPSTSGEELLIANCLESALGANNNLEIIRVGNTVAARTQVGRKSRMLWAGHIDTVPPNPHHDSSSFPGFISGRGSVDMKSGVAAGLKLAVELENPPTDLTWIFYDNEEVDSELNGLGLFAAKHRDWMRADLAILGEPTNNALELGCNGTLRFVVSAKGKRAHSARSWMGSNAIHSASEILFLLQNYRAEVVDVDGLKFCEGLNAVNIEGGVAGNVIPDNCSVTINYRFAPNKSVENAKALMKNIFSSYDLVFVDAAPGAQPRLSDPLLKKFLDDAGLEVQAKQGWTDVARFSSLGIPAVNFGPGDPALAHSDDEKVSVAEVEAYFTALSSLLGSSGLTKNFS